MKGQGDGGNRHLDRIMQTAMGFWASKTLMSAVELGVFGVLAARPLDEASLRQRLSIHERAGTRLFRRVVAQGLLRRDQDGLYATAQRRRVSRPRRVRLYRRIIEMFNARLYGFWGTLTEGLRTARPQNEAKRR